jgi:protein-L-isoaspartate(D-aspartate) O-methyltransferase
VLKAFASVPRHLLVPEAPRDRAYPETPIPIGEGQTISAPGVVAAMTITMTMTMALALEGHERVLEIGTGSGYQAAILSQLVSELISIERIPRLAASARTALDSFGITNVVVYLGDGTCGRPDLAPFDRIVVTAGGPEVPKALLDQLTPGGMLVGPFGERGAQLLTRIRARPDNRFTREVLGECDFVDLIGQNGWQA